jgi:hypothetical protein
LKWRKKRNYGKKLIQTNEDEFPKKQVRKKIRPLSATHLLSKCSEIMKLRRQLMILLHKVKDSRDGGAKSQQLWFNTMGINSQGILCINFRGGKDFC